MCYVCNRCGDLVDEIPTYTESAEIWGHMEYWEEAENCSCGGAYVEADTCKWCGEYCCLELVDGKLISEFEDIPEEWIKDSDYADVDPYSMCDDCLKEAINAYKEYLKENQNVKS